MQNDAFFGTQGREALLGVIALMPPVDVTSDDEPFVSCARDLLGGLPSHKPTEAKRASPLRHVNARAPAHCLIHGTEDALVPIQHSAQLHDALQTCGVASDFMRVPGVGHDSGGLYGNAAAVQFMQTFLAQQLAQLNA
jgi:dipeptidyl aminopeptidase/acylaminoacyl peptidase